MNSIVIEARPGEAGAVELDPWLYNAGVAVDAEQTAIASVKRSEELTPWAKRRFDPLHLLVVSFVSSAAP
ncbi:hypothetical protein ABIE33_005509, partial [Ensifer sp. 4252]